MFQILAMKLNTAKKNWLQYTQNGGKYNTRAGTEIRTLQGVRDFDRRKYMEIKHTYKV